MTRIEAGIGTSTGSYYWSRTLKKREKHGGEINKDVTSLLTCFQLSAPAPIISSFLKRAVAEETQGGCWCETHHGDVLSRLLQLVFDPPGDVPQVRQRELPELDGTQDAGVRLKHLQSLEEGEGGRGGQREVMTSQQQAGSSARPYTQKSSFHSVRRIKKLLSSRLVCRPCGLRLCIWATAARPIAEGSAGQTLNCSHWGGQRPPLASEWVSE